MASGYGYASDMFSGLQISLKFLDKTSCFYFFIKSMLQSASRMAVVACIVKSQ